jgi:hypothetical protein
MQSKNPMDTFTEADIARLRAAFERELPCRLREVDGDPAFAFTLGTKTVEFRWPQSCREELWVALFPTEQDYLAFDADLVMFEEPATERGRAWMLEFFERLGWRYLRWPTRVCRQGGALNALKLEYFVGTAWKDIYREFDH